jgi:CheY-like chemotaxis protein/HD-like signal output (HDOD) protein
MKSILIVDDHAVLREPLAASLRQVGHTVECAANGKEAVQLLETFRPDLILLDVAMPTMDGITFLRRLRAEPAIAGTRVILLTVISAKEQVLAARSLGVKEYILKANFHLNELLARIEKDDTQTASGQPAAASAGAKDKPAAAGTPTTKKVGDIPQLLTRDQLLEKVERVFQTKTLSGVVAEVIAVASSDRGETTQLAALISRDPMLSARVLQVANSASYASGSPVTTVADAIRKVGYTAIRNIAAALGVFDCMPEAGKDGFSPIHCWQHSFAVAQLCELFATEGHLNQSGLAYIIGLCHDLGDIFIHTQFADEYRQVIELAAKTGKPREEIFGLMMGMTPSQMIAAVHKCLLLPETICKPIELLHVGIGPKSDNPLTRMLWMAENYANAAMLASSPSSQVAPLTQQFCRAAMGQPNPTRPDPAKMRTGVVAMTVALARLSRHEEQKLLAPMFKMHKAGVFIARSPGVSEFDPIELAITSLAKTKLSDRLPANREADGCGGMIVIAPSNEQAGFSTMEIESVAAKYRVAGRAFPVTMVCAEAKQMDGATDNPWRTELTLADLAALAESLDKNAPVQAAA